jgi:Arc/MetJ-type ribon-helix-helix transcriptional regulator
VSDEAKRENVTVRLTPKGIERLDSLRGAWSRSEYIRQAIAHAAKNNMKGPEEVQW